MIEFSSRRRDFNRTGRTSRPRQPDRRRALVGNISRRQVPSNGNCGIGSLVLVLRASHLPFVVATTGIYFEGAA